MTKKNNLKYGLSHEKRVDVIQKIILNKLKNFPADFNSYHAFNLGLLLSKTEAIVNFLEYEESWQLTSEDKSAKDAVDRTFRELIGLPLSLDAIDKNVSVLTLT